MRDEQDGPVECVERPLQLLDRRNVEMVRRLVEDQAVDAARREQRDQRPRALAGRKRCRVAQDVVGAEAELGQQPARIFVR